MLEKLFYNIGFFYTKVRFLRKKDVVQNFTTFLYRDSRILVIMPFELGEFDKAKMAMLNLKREWPSLQISMVVQAQYLTYSGLAGEFNIFAFGAKDVNKFSLPKRKFLKQVLSHDYDVVIDFNKVMNLPSSFISKRMDVRYRISFIKEYVDRFFNVQFNQDSVPDDRNIYSRLMNQLKHFYSEEESPRPKTIIHPEPEPEPELEIEPNDEPAAELVDHEKPTEETGTSEKTELTEPTETSEKTEPTAQTQRNIDYKRNKKNRKRKR